ncbi:MAG: LamG-like jellyroll fold domain-containing protein, partial [Planctomycetota bacterium]
MFKRFVLILTALLLCQAGTVGAAEIIVITEWGDKDLDRLEDDQELIDWLIAKGYSVDVRRNNWMHLDSDKISDLNAADLIIVSRLANSGIYKHGDEPTQWNSVTTPLLLMSPYFARNSIWNWVNSMMVTNDTPDTYAAVVDPDHPVFRGVSLRAPDPIDRIEPAMVVQVIDPFVGTGITSFIGTADMGNGRLIAKPVGMLGTAWIAEWDAGVEFYEGAGQFTGGKRMLFCAGTQEIGNMCQGKFNLTADGQQMLHNAITYLLGSANIILVTEDTDWNLDGIRDDYNLETFLLSEGHCLDIRPNYWKNLDPNKITELNAADLIIFSRTTNSANYDDGDEKTQWNSLTTPLLQMNAYFARNSRWEWVNHWNTTNDTAVVYLEAVKVTHPIFIDMLLSSYDPDGQPDVAQMTDPNVASGITSFIDTTDMGNGHLIAKPVGFEMGWIAEWDAGVEFFEGANEYTGGRRMLFSAGTQEIEFFDPETGEMIRTAYGELNLTAEGLQMFRNAIDYLLNPEFADLIYEESTECIVAHWKLDEIEGRIAYDSVGDNDGILYGNPIWQPMGGILGGALEFDGDNDYVDCGTFNPSDATGQLSICLWAKWNGLNGRYQCLIAKRNSWNVNDMMWQLEASQISGDAMFEREGYAGVVGGILTEGDWEHWCVTFDGATAIIYRMGEEVNRGAFSFG